MRKRLLATVALCGAVAGLLWIWAMRSSTELTSNRPDLSRAKTALIGVPVTPATTEPRQISDRSDPQKMFEAVEATNVPINFWGKVIDQDVLPVAGAKIEYDFSIEHGNLSGVAWSDQETRTGQAVTDGDGLFSIQGVKGHVLGILVVKHPDYQYRSKEALSFDFYGSTASGKFVPDQRKPVIFTMVHKQRLEPLIHLDGTLHVRGDGTPERWNLWSGDADPSGELAVTFRADPGVSATPAHFLSWSAELEVVGGGITEASWDEDVRRAPESGYSPTVAYPRLDQKQGVPHRSFYLRTVDGKYGRIQVELSTSHDGRTARCFISGDMNPRPGSRNLEPSEE